MSTAVTAADIESLDWDKGGGLLPAIVQHAHNGRILMLGYVDRDALARSFASGNAVFFSRTRQRLWMKGETSGNTLALRGVVTDCDRDTVLFSVEPAGPVCHLGTVSCFGSARPFLDRLDALVASRLQERPTGSYTTELAAAGTAAAAQKVGEEAIEVGLAAVGESAERVTSEAADLIYHLLVLLQLRGLRLDGVIGELERRHTLSD